MSAAAAPAFVLIHGGRHGGWVWRTVAAQLRRAGHEVFAPTLTGLGERSHLLRPDIGLAVHVEDVVKVVEYEDVEDLIFVAHSYGAMPVYGAMERLADRVRHLVVVDGNVPRSGLSVFDLIGPERAARMLAMAEEEGDGWYVPVSDSRWWGLTDEAHIRWVNSKISPQPIRTYQERLDSTARATAHPTTFVACTPSRVEPGELDLLRARAATDAGFDFVQLDVGHELMVSDPEVLTGLLLELAAASSPSVRASRANDDQEAVTP